MTGQTKKKEPCQQILIIFATTFGVRLRPPLVSPSANTRGGWLPSPKAIWRKQSLLTLLFKAVRAACTNHQPTTSPLTSNHQPPTTNHRREAAGTLFRWCSPKAICCLRPSAHQRWLMVRSGGLVIGRGAGREGETVFLLGSFYFLFIFYLIQILWLNHFYLVLY